MYSLLRWVGVEWSTWSLWLSAGDRWCCPGSTPCLRSSQPITETSSSNSSSSLSTRSLSSCARTARSVSAWFIGIALHGKLVLEQRSITCHRGSHSITCHLTQVNTFCHNPNQTGRYSIYPYSRRMEGWVLTLVLVIYRHVLPVGRQSPIQVASHLGDELTTSRSQVQHANRYITKPSNGIFRNAKWGPCGRGSFILYIADIHFEKCFKFVLQTAPPVAIWCFFSVDTLYLGLRCAVCRNTFQCQRQCTCLHSCTSLACSCTTPAHHLRLLWRTDIYAPGSR